MPRALLVVLVLLTAGCAGLVPDPGAPGEGSFGGLVSSSSPLAAAAAADMLRAGGSAVDAAAAAQWALTVAEPHFSGIGGGAFVLVREGATGAVVLLDGRERAPAATTRDQFMLPGVGEPQPFDLAHTRGYAVGVPGAVKVFAEAHARFGRLSWAQTFGPAIALAESGFEVDAKMAGHLTNHADRLRTWPPTARIYLKDAVCPPEVAGLASPSGCVGGAPFAEGETLRNPDLAATLRLLAEGGPDAFYRGPLAEAIALTTQQRLGRMTAADLSAYEVVEREPLRGRYHGREVVTAGSPAGGPILLNMLGILEGLPVAEAGPASGQRYHYVIEATRLAYADRAAYNADPDVVDVPQRGLAHPAYAAERRALVSEGSAMARVEAGDPWRYEDAPMPERAGEGAPGDEVHTSHLVVVDAEGTIVSTTMTIENVWGTGLVVPAYGFLLNNELTDFDFRPGGANEPGPNKRPRSSMVPTIVLQDGEPVMVVGASGGGTITPSVAQVIVNVVDHGMDAHSAVAASRVYGASDPIRWDRGLPADVRRDLEARGHRLSAEEGLVSQVQVALRVDGAWVGAADDRAAVGGVVLVGPAVR